MGVTLENGKISVLKYADNVVLIARDAEVLQEALRALKQFCTDNRLTVNTDKSKLMCFTKKRPTLLPILSYGEHQLEWVTEVKYLGVTFSHRNTLVGGLEVLCQQAHKAQSVVDLHILKHETVSVQYIFNL